MYSSPAIDPRPSVRFSTACKIDLDLSGFSFALTKYRIEKNVTSKAFDRKTEVTQGAPSGRPWCPMAAYRKLFMSGGVGYSPTFSMRRTASTLIFLHVPKTGGTTFRKILERSYSGEAVLTLKGADYTADFENFANSAESERRRYRLIQGHLYFGFHDLVPGDSSYVVWLRDPIARALSFYAHVTTHSDHYLHQRVIDERLDLRTLVGA